LENILTDVLAKLDNTSSSINAILSDENKAAFKNALADISAVTRMIAARKEAIDKVIVSAARTFDNSARATGQLERVIARIGKSAESVEKMGDEVARTSTSAGKAVDSVGADVARFTAEALPEFERLLGEMSVLAASLRRLSEKMEGSPGGLLMGRRPVPPGPGEAVGKEAGKGAAK
jgi:phospholipid/cholesterol/gamma-HCH transport system substrate-binding protein